MQHPGPCRGVWAYIFSDPEVLCYAEYRNTATK
jgi:hypothetical protein